MRRVRQTTIRVTNQWREAPCGAAVRDRVPRDMRTYRQHWTPRITEDLLGDGAQGKAPESAPPVRPNHDQIDPALDGGQVHDVRDLALRQQGFQRDFLERWRPEKLGQRLGTAPPRLLEREGRVFWRDDRKFVGH